MVEVLCSYLVDAMEALGERAGDLAPLVEHWRLNATLGWHPNDLRLDEHCERREPRIRVLRALDDAQKQLLAKRELTGDELHGRGVGGAGVVWSRTHPIPTASVVKLARACALLLRGELRPWPRSRGQHKEVWDVYCASQDLALVPEILRREVPLDWEDDERQTLSLNARHALWSLEARVAGVSDAELSAFEQWLGRRCPADYAEVLRSIHGGVGRLRNHALVELSTLEDARRSAPSPPKSIVVATDGDRASASLDLSQEQAHVSVSIDGRPAWMAESFSAFLERLAATGW